MGLSFQQLQDLWTQAGGNPAAAAIAAAVALAESGGNPNAINTNGGKSTDRGLWQINSVHGSQSTFDPIANARAAVAISNNGTNWKPWCVAYTDGACGTKGGAYSPTGASPAGKRLTTNGGSATLPTDPGGSGGSGGTATPVVNGPLSSDFWNGLADNFVAGILKFANHALFVGAALFGGATMMIGLFLMFRETSQGRSVGVAIQQTGNAYRNMALKVVK